MGVEGFTSSFLLFQLSLFLFLIFFQLIRIFKEIFVLNMIKAQIISINREDDSDIKTIDKKINDMFLNKKKSRYKELWNRYYTRVSHKNEDERINVDPFFGFDVMHHHLGYRPLMDVGAGINVSIGVLGTFIGLSVGLADLQLGDTDALRSGIGGLLDGMKVAFYSSVFGVLLSLFWTFFDRLLSSKLDKEIDWHSERMDYLLSTDDEELFLNRLEKISRNQADHLKTLLTDALENAMKPIVGTIQTSNGQISSAFGQLSDQFSQLQSGVDNQSKLLEKQIEFTKTNSQDISEKLVEQITGGTQQSITDFSGVIKDSQNLQTQMIETVNHVVSSLANTEKSQSSTLEKTERMFTQFERMSGELEQMRSSYSEASKFMVDLSGAFQQIQQLTQQQLPVQLDVMKSNQSLAQKYDGLTERFKDFNSNMERKYGDLLEEVLTVSNSLSDSFKDLTERFSASLRTQAKTVEESELLLQNIKEVVLNLTPIAPELKEVVGNIQDLKNHLSEMQGIQNKLLPEIKELKAQTNDTIGDALQTTKVYMAEMSSQIETMKDNWQSAKSQFENTRVTLDTSVKDFSDNIESGLSKTYHHFDETLTKAVKEVSQLIFQFSELQADFVDNLEELSEEIGKAKEGSA